MRWRRARCLPSPSACRSARAWSISATTDGQIGRHGGELRMLSGREKDVRMLVVYGYARLVAYDRNFALVPDLLESCEVDEGRIFTLRLRPGLRWSDGHRVSAEDFRYFWEDIAGNETLAPFGPSRALRVKGRFPRASRCSTSTRSGTRGTSRTPSSFPPSPARGPSRYSRPRTTSGGSTPATPTRRSSRSSRRRRGGATGGRCTSTASAPTRTPTRSFLPSSPGSTLPGRPRSATCSSATPSTTGWMGRAGSFPTSTGWSSTSPTPS